MCLLVLLLRTCDMYVSRKGLATVLVVMGCGLACEPASRIAAPPADRVHWKISGPAFPLVPTFDSATAFFASENHQVIAIDRRSGKVRWSSSTANGTDGTTAGSRAPIVTPPERWGSSIVAGHEERATRMLQYHWLANKCVELLHPST